MGNKWNDQWWSLVKAEKHKEEQHVRTVKRKAKRVRRRKRR
jgi:hypothetical protein